jgi:hypothetical protein
MPKHLRRIVALGAAIVVVCLGACGGSDPNERTQPHVYLVRYEVDVCDSCSRDPIPEVTYVPYWRKRWRHVEGIRLEDVAVPWSYTFRAYHLDRLTVRAYGDTFLECRVLADGK